MKMFVYNYNLTIYNKLLLWNQVLKRAYGNNSEDVPNHLMSAAYKAFVTIATKTSIEILG